MPYDAIVFDMDGVLLTGYHTDRAVYRQAARETLEAFGRPDATVTDELADPPDSDTLRELCGDLGVPPAEYWGYREHASTSLENDRIAAGSREAFSDTAMLESLAEEVDIGIVSNNRHGTVRFVVDYFGLEAVVDAVNGRHPSLAAFDRLKPDPYLLELSIADLGVAPERTLFVGDRRSDVVTAERAGTDSALLVREGDPPDGDGDPTFQIESLEELVDILADGG